MLVISTQTACAYFTSQFYNDIFAMEKGIMINEIPCVPVLLHSLLSSCQYSEYGMLILPLTLNEVDYCAIIVQVKRKKKKKEKIS